MKHLLILLLLLLLPVVAGCLRLDREAPPRDFYALEAHREAEPSEIPHFGAVRVYRFEAPPRFGGDRFVYRPEELRYEDDYYNRFISPPGVLVAEEVRRWFDTSGLFREVLAAPARIEPAYLLEGRIVEIYGDFRKTPTAVLALEISFVHDAKARSEILLRRTYRSTQPLEEASPGALAQGWSRALEEILRTLEDDLRVVAQDR
jgi:cholesterol transport system auxiliary component